jgi:hypothetical protein
MKDIALKLRRSVKAIDKLSRRKKNPLPLQRGRGRPFIFESALNHWLTTPALNAAAVRMVFG